MSSTCKCGGKLLHKDENRFWFRVQCTVCKVIRKQRKRQSKEITS
jgi:phage FluMu protein Com